MIPSNSLSVYPVTADFLYPDNLLPQDITPIDWEMGGIALNDPSRGINYQAWEFRLEDDNIVTQPLSGGTKTTLLSGMANVTELSGCFDANMQPVVAYAQGEVTKLYWYDPTVPGFVTTDYAGCISPKLTLDDKRPLESLTQDVLLFYLRDRLLCFRQQRERYGVEHVLMACSTSVIRLGRVGMHIANRVQVEFLRSG